MARRTAVLTVVITSLIAVLAMNTKLLQGQAAVPTIQTDKSDYHPGEFVTVTGSGFVEGENVSLEFHERLDVPIHPDVVINDVLVGPSGTFTDSRYQLATHDEGVSYLLTATGLSSGRVAQVYFTDASLGSLDQCANGSLASPDPTPCRGTEAPSPDSNNEGWVNGNLGGSKSHYAEGDSVPYRYMFTGMATGAVVHTLTIEWDTTKGGKHALDYLTTFNRTVNANPCAGVTGCNEATFDTEPIPADEQVTDAGVTPIAGAFRLYGGNITSVSPYGYSHGAGFDGDKSASITISFTTTVANPVLAWGGHIATRPDWGETNSAVAIDGSPYHMRLIGVDNDVVDPNDNGPGGNQDRSLSADAVIFPASITIIKDTVPNHAQDFAFSTTGGLTQSPFNLDDDSGAAGADNTLSNTRVFSGILVTAQNGNDYTVSETTVSPWALSFGTPVCTVASPNGGSQSASSNTLSINLREGEDVTCTFINTRQSASLTLVKNVVSDNGGTATATQWTLNASGPGGPYGGSGGGTFQVDPGSFTLSETGTVTGYTNGTTYSCVKNGGSAVDGNSITLANGDNATCTITNNDDAPKLTLVKTVTNDNGGSALETAWTLTANGAGQSPTNLSGTTPVSSGATFKADTYTLAESNGPANYTAGTYSCALTGTNTSVPVNGSSQVTVGLGQDVTCTINNNDNAPALHLVKTVTNDNGGSAAVTAWTLTATGTGQNPTNLTGTTPVNSGATFKADTYTLAESNGPANYTAGTYSCVLTGTNTTVPVNGSSQVTVGFGQDVTCTLNNNDNAPALHLIKTVTNDNGGTALVTAWTLTATGTGQTPTNLTGTTPVNSGATFKADTYTLAESNGPANYTAGTYSCVLTGTNTSVPVNGSSQVTVAFGQDVTCTINNNDNPPSLTLAKQVVNDNGGTATASQWTLSANGPTPISGAGGVSSGATFSAGTYTLSESGTVAGYTNGTTYSCVKNGAAPVSGNSITLANGDTATCRIRNDDIAPSLTLVKQVVSDNGGTATASQWTLIANGGPTPISGAGGVSSGATFRAGTYTLSETGTVYGYANGTTYSCVKNGASAVSGNSIALAVGDTATCTIINNDIGGTIIIIKNAKPANGSFSFTANGPNSYTNTFALTGSTASDGNKKTLSGLYIGNYTVQESMQLGWLLTGIGGSTDPNTPLACTVNTGGTSTGTGSLTTRTATINLKNGDTVTCVFENTGNGATRTQGFWATHPQLAQIAWFGGTAFNHTFPGVAATAGIGDTLICGRPIDDLGKVMGSFWSDIAKKSNGSKRLALDQNRMQLLQQLIAAELNASAFGSVPANGTFAAWEAALCGTTTSAINSAQQQAGSFNSAGDSATFTPGTSADSKGARAVANIPFWDIIKP
jgi:hypothetical protein